MGQDAQHKADRRHFRKFMDGRYTPQEVHRALAFRKPCLCGQPAAIRILALGDKKELVQKYPDFLGFLAAQHEEGKVPIVRTRWGEMIKVGEVWACDTCKHDAEKAAAKHPSWVHVWIDRGIEAEKTQVQVGG